MMLMDDGVTTGDVIAHALLEAGVDHLFFTSGSEIGFFQEALAKMAENHPENSVRLISIPHEHVAVNAAIGYAAFGRRPAAVAVHVDCGTLNLGGGIHTALRSHLPVLIFAGYPPTAYPGSMPGSRDEGGHLWMQETRDQHSIVRNYVKWDRRLSSQDNPGMAVSRAAQLALSEPQGPVYMSIPKEIPLAAPLTTEFPTTNDLRTTEPLCPSPSAVHEIAKRLITAECPVIVVSHSGRNPETVEPLVELSESLGIAVCSARTRGYLSFPLTHRNLVDQPTLGAADVVLVLEARVPWIPGRDCPASDTWVAVVGTDPLATQIPMAEFAANVRVAADPLAFIRALGLEIAELASTIDLDAVRHRNRRLETASALRRLELDDQAHSEGQSTEIGTRWASKCIADAVGNDCIIIDDTLPRAGLCDYLKLDSPGTYFGNPGSSGGLAAGAALGAKLAAPHKTVVAVTGDGFYMFGSPAIALWAATHYGAPFMIVVLTNRSYSTGVLRVAAAYGRDGYAARSGFEGGYFDPPIDFAKEAEAAGAAGLTVSDPRELPRVLIHGLELVRSGSTVLVNVWMPKLLEDENSIAVGR